LASLKLAEQGSNKDSIAHRASNIIGDKMKKQRIQKILNQSLQPQNLLPYLQEDANIEKFVNKVKMDINLDHQTFLE
jgi:hypothetical protein